MPNFADKIILVLFLLGLLLQEGNAAPPRSDLSFLAEKPQDENSLVHDHSIRFMRTRSANVLIRYNPVSLALGGMMYTYQKFISPQLPSECFYEVSCSAFSKDLIYQYGIVKGVLFTSDRLMRCNRLSALDVHPLLVIETTGRVMEAPDIYEGGWP